MNTISRCVSVSSIIFCLSSCGAPREQTVVSTPPAATVQMQPTTLPTAIQPILQAPPQMALPADWTTIAWQGVIVPLPPQAQWQTLSVESATDPVAPISARGAISYTTQQEGVEERYGPLFTIYSFPDSIEAWINLQQQHNANAVDTATITNVTLAGQPAKRYQPTITGTCNSGYYIAKIDTTHLLEVATECIDTQPYTLIIKQLSIQKP